jgi:hypothetical protein
MNNFKAQLNNRGYNSFREYLYEISEESNQVHETITYDNYCYLLDNVSSIDEGLLDLGKFKKIYKDIKQLIFKIKKSISLSVSEIISALKNRDIFALLKSLKFSFAKLLKAFSTLSGLVRKGLFKVFESAFNTKAIQMIRKGTLKIDDILNKHPILKKVTGLIIAALLIYMWLNMSFIGDLDYDFNFGDIISAISGSFSLTELFISPSGLMLIALFSTGGVMSVAWLGSSTLNLLLGLVYTGYTKLKNSNNKTINKLKGMITKH